MLLSSSTFYQLRSSIASYGCAFYFFYGKETLPPPGYRKEVTPNVHKTTKNKTSQNTMLCSYTAALFITRCELPDAFSCPQAGHLSAEQPAADCGLQEPGGRGGEPAQGTLRL